MKGGSGGTGAEVRSNVIIGPTEEIDTTILSTTPSHMFSMYSDILFVCMRLPVVESALWFLERNTQKKSIEELFTPFFCLLVCMRVSWESAIRVTRG